MPPVVVDGEHDPGRTRTAGDHVASLGNLPDDIVAAVLADVANAADRPGDLLSVFMTCKKFYSLGWSPIVIKSASPGALSIPAKSWCPGAKIFLQRCEEAGSIDASFMLGMIFFYYLKLRDDGIAKITSAASKGHTEATYSLAVILFNGSGGAEVSRDIPAAVALCQQAASNGHLIALRELGFCTHDGYGICQDKQEGHRLVDLARSLEMAEALDPTGSLFGPVRHGKGGAPHIANRFMVEWFKLGKSNVLEEFRMCSNALCGRQETRAREFRCCAVCTTATYCSRACQSRHWTKQHRMVCYPH